MLLHINRRINEHVLKTYENTNGIKSIYGKDAPSLILIPYL
jgi:hypothetical protein